MRSIYYTNDTRFCYDKELREAFDNINKSTGFQLSADNILKNVINFLLSKHLTCCHWKETAEQNNKAFFLQFNENQDGIVDLT